jgi:hypothetical protein
MAPQFGSHVKGQGVHFMQDFLDIRVVIPPGPSCDISELIGDDYLVLTDGTIRSKLHKGSIPFDSSIDCRFRVCRQRVCR